MAPKTRAQKAKAIASGKALATEVRVPLDAPRANTITVFEDSSLSEEDVPLIRKKTSKNATTSEQVSQIPISVETEVFEEVAVTSEVRTEVEEGVEIRENGDLGVDLNMQEEITTKQSWKEVVEEVQISGKKRETERELEEQEKNEKVEKEKKRKRTERGKKKVVLEEESVEKVREEGQTVDTEEIQPPMVERTMEEGESSKPVRKKQGALKKPKKTVVTSGNWKEFRCAFGGFLVSQKAVERSQNMADRQIFQEQGFASEGLNEQLEETIENFGWKYLVRPYEPARPDWIREFYCNINEEAEFKSRVRGVDVDWSAQSINELLRFADKPGAMFNQLCKKPSEELLDVCLKRIGGEGATWLVEKGTKVVLASFLNAEAHCWLNFVGTSLMPTTHWTEVIRSRALLVYAILEGWSIDVGKIIAGEIKRCINKKEGKLFFPHLITSLCLRQGVQPFVDDELLPVRSVYASPASRSRVVHVGKGVGIAASIDELIRRQQAQEEVLADFAHKFKIFMTYFQQRESVLSINAELRGEMQLPSFPPELIINVAGSSVPPYPEPQSDEAPSHSSSSPQF